MNKKISVSVAITVALIAMTVTFSITMIVAMQIFDNTVTSVNEKQSMYNKLAEIDKYVRANAYNTIDDATLNDYIAYGYMLGINDKNAKYYTEKEYSDLLAVQNGKLLGIGVDLIKDTATGYGRVIRVYSGSPAAELGIEAGSYITRIGETDTKNLTKDGMLTRLRGEDGTTVTITYLTRGTSEEKTVEVTHVGYTTPTVEYQTLNDTYGYVRITQFGSTTASELDYAVNQLTGAGVTALVFDLRDNEGGLLDSANECIDLLVGEGVIAYAEYSDGTREILAESDANKVDLPMICLVNGNTASSAELFAASLRDMAGAKLVGTKTYGKGTIQAAPQRLSDGSAVSVTVARLLTGKEECFDGTGLTVDQEVQLAENTVMYDYALAEDAQVLRAVSVADTLTGVTTMEGSSNAGTQTGTDSSAAGEDGSSAAESTDGETGETGDSAAAEGGDSSADSAA